VANRWNIPTSLEREVVARDRTCVYCQVVFTSTPAERRFRPSWEHIVNDARIITRENIALCCVGCNASKGAKTLAVWLESKYCKSRGITLDTVSDIVRSAHANPPSITEARA
jgi:hypothetical protein